MQSEASRRRSEFMGRVGEGRLRDRPGRRWSKGKGRRRVAQVAAILHERPFAHFRVFFAERGVQFSVSTAKPMSSPLTMTAPLRRETTPPGRALRILYAEDLRDLREVARMALSRDGHVIECVVDGSVALERLTAAPDSVDLLITDHHMPVMNGRSWSPHCAHRDSRARSSCLAPS